MGHKNDKVNKVNEVLGLPLAEEFEHDLAVRIEAAEEIESVVIAFIDIDHFKLINDNYGYEVGDNIIITMAKQLVSSLPTEPEGTKLYRYGGDEFAVLFGEGIEKESALLIMEEFRRSYDQTLPDGSKMTVSIGIASAFEDGARVPELERKADGAMFRAKLNGRNRICLAREEKMITKTSHYTADQLQRLTKLSKREGIGEAILLREALDALLKKYDV